MTLCLSQLISHGDKINDDALAIVDKKRRISYGELAHSVRQVAYGLIHSGAQKNDRIAVYLPKQLEAVTTMFGAAEAGCIFVPVNPLLKPGQVHHILTDCDVRVLVTSRQRATGLKAILEQCPSLRLIVLIDEQKDFQASINIMSWSEFTTREPHKLHRIIDCDVASILYTSGSTGRPKGVVLSHKNMVTGAYSVSEYLENQPHDKLLAVLPFSFDYGFSQLSTAFCRGASVVLMEYLLPRDVIRKVADEQITGLAGVPPLWNQLASLDWPESVSDHLRYITNSGGAMPKVTLASLRKALPKTHPYLMYGLTEAFRSTYLPPDQLDERPDSMGKAIPNAEIVVINDNGGFCAAGETGELVHRGSLVSLGYWNSPEKTALRFKPVPNPQTGLVLDEIAVWSGDRVRIDDEGYLYFVGRRDEMIKTSGYRVSPNEVEEALFSSGLVSEAVAMGVEDEQLGQAIAVVVMPAADKEKDSDALLIACRNELANFMIPKHIIWMDDLPRNANGKIDRSGLAQQLPSLLEALKS